MRPLGFLLTITESDDMMKKAKPHPIYIFLAGVLWGSMGLFVRVYNENSMITMDIVAIRAIVTVLFMLIFLLIYDRSLLRIKIQDIWCFLGTGVLSILFFNYCYFKAITLTSLSVAAVLLYTAPAIVMILSRILFKERFTVIKTVSLIATFIGCIFVTGLLGNADSLNAMGILIGLGAGLGYALYSIFSRFAIERGYHTYTIIFYTFLIAGTLTLPFAKWGDIGNAIIDKPSLIGFSFIFGLVSTVLPYILYTVGLQKVENGKASIIASVEPVVATILGMVLYHEKLHANEIIGIVLVLGAIILCNLSPKTPKNEKLNK